MLAYTAAHRPRARLRRAGHLLVLRQPRSPRRRPHDPRSQPAPHRPRRSASRRSPSTGGSVPAAVGRPRRRRVVGAARGCGGGRGRRPGGRRRVDLRRRARGRAAGLRPPDHPLRLAHPVRRAHVDAGRAGARRRRRLLVVLNPAAALRPHCREARRLGRAARSGCRRAGGLPRRDLGRPRPRSTRRVSASEPELNVRRVFSRGRRPRSCSVRTASSPAGRSAGEDDVARVRRGSARRRGRASRTRPSDRPRLLGSSRARPRPLRRRAHPGWRDAAAGAARRAGRTGAGRAVGGRRRPRR